MRQSWTDDRLDDLSCRMDERFDQLEGQIGDARTEARTTANNLRAETKALGRELRGEIKAQGQDLRSEIKAQGKELRGEMAGLEARLRSQASEHYARTGEAFAGIREELVKLHDNHQQLHTEMYALHRTISRLGWSVAGTLVAAIVGMLLTQL